MPAVPFGGLNWQLRQDSDRSQMHRREIFRNLRAEACWGIRLSVAVLAQNESFSWCRTSNKYQLSLIHPAVEGRSANQRHPLSPAAILLSRNPKQQKQVGGFRSLQEGQTVEFGVTKGTKGFQAENVRPL